MNSRYGSMEIEVPQDRKSTFEPQVVKKRHKVLLKQLFELLVSKGFCPKKFDMSNIHLHTSCILSSVLLTLVVNIK